SVTVAALRLRAAEARSVAALQDLMWQNAGLLRDASGLRKLRAVAEAWQVAPIRAASRADLELGNLTLLAHLVATAALLRDESRGGHYRTDHPDKSADWRSEIVMVGEHPESLAVGFATERDAVLGSPGARMQA